MSIRVRTHIQQRRLIWRRAGRLKDLPRGGSGGSLSGALGGLAAAWRTASSGGTTAGREPQDSGPRDSWQRRGHEAVDGEDEAGGEQARRPWTRRCHGESRHTEDSVPLKVLNQFPPSLHKAWLMRKRTREARSVQTVRSTAQSTRAACC